MENQGILDFYKYPTHFLKVKLRKMCWFSNVLITYTFDTQWYKSKKSATPGSALDRAAVVVEVVQF